MNALMAKSQVNWLPTAASSLMSTSPVPACASAVGQYFVPLCTSNPLSFLLLFSW